MFRTLRRLIHNRLHRVEIYSKPEFWDSKAREFKDEAVSMWPNNHLNRLYHKESIEVFDRLLPDVAGKHILDIGCGSGRLTRHFSDRGAKVIGVDFSPLTIELARQQDSRGAAEYRVMSLFDLEEVEQYDYAVSWATLGTACRNEAELTECLKRIGRALKPQGEAVFIEPVHTSFLHRVLSTSPREMVHRMQKTGFDTAPVQHLSFWPARLLLAFLPWPNWFTRAVYHIGQFIMNVFFRGRRVGDYQVFYGKLR